MTTPYTFKDCKRSWAHTFTTKNGHRVLFPAMPTHSTREAAEACPSNLIVEAITGLAPAEPKEVLETPDGFLLYHGIPIKDKPENPASPFGPVTLVGGPVFEEEVQKQKMNGLPLISLDDEAAVNGVLAEHYKVANDNIPTPSVGHA